MGRKVIITGSTGMIGNLILKSCLRSGQISEVVSLVRKSTPANTPENKLREIVVSNFEDYSDHNDVFKNVDMAFFCIGVYTGQVDQELFKKITVDYAVAFARKLKEQSPEATLCLLSGAGADRSEKSNTPFARFKGMAENQISGLGLNFYTFRPAYIYPVEKRKEPNGMYSLMRTLYPLVKLFGNNASIRSTELAAVMLHVGLKGADKQILENRDIKLLADSFV